MTKQAEKPWWQRAWVYDAAVFLLAVLTNLILWVNHEQTPRIASLRQLWLSAHYPHGWFDALLNLWDAAMLPSIAAMMLLNSLSLWVFVRIALTVGIGRITAFCLFFLINFNPELNAMRFAVHPGQVGVLLWLLSTWGFLAHYRERFYLAFVFWAGFLWLCVPFQPQAAVWALGFPLCFLLWPGSGGWRQRLWERGRFLLAYYALIAIVFFGWLGSWQEMLAMLDAAQTRFARVRLEMSMLVGGDSAYVLSIGSALAIAVVLVVIKALKATGFLILFFLWLSAWRGLKSVLYKRVALFMAVSLLFAVFAGAWGFLYHGRLPDDLEYQPIVMLLLLWRAAPGVFYVYNRVRERRIAPERALIGGWLLAAYALGTLVHFGPTAGYRREAGEWARSQSYVHLYSNVGETLYFAGGNPLPYSPDFMDIGVPGASFYRIGKNDILLHTQHRKQPLPEDFAAFTVLKTFANSRGDKVYALRLKDSHAP
ncbi:MAG: hypothetical protein Q4D61_07355 [Cardiobacteriaceae bacterium]|nr:hypothetical protein [Cardiobacteriaceae bacterium]